MIKALQIKDDLKNLFSNAVPVLSEVRTQLSFDQNVNDYPVAWITIGETQRGYELGGIKTGRTEYLIDVAVKLDPDPVANVYSIMYAFEGQIDTLCRTSTVDGLRKASVLLFETDGGIAHPVSQGRMLVSVEYQEN